MGRPFRCHQTEGATGGTVLCLVDLKDIRLEVELSVRDVPRVSGKTASSSELLALVHFEATEVLRRH